MDSTYVDDILDDDIEDVTDQRIAEREANQEVIDLTNTNSDEETNDEIDNNDSDNTHE